MLLSGNYQIPLVVILGPTAVGKTKTAIEVAKELNGEIISADSRQVYRFMDIGTAKPTLEQRTVVPHYLIDVVDPDTPYNVVDFQAQTLELIVDIHQRGKLPMLVGGTGQYITAVLEGWQFPNVEADSQLRAELEDYAAHNGWEALLERLRQYDPITAERIDGRNIRRVIRALEVCLVAGKPFSSLRKKNPPPFDIKTFGLTLEPRQQLYDRANARIDIMLEDGLVDEVHSLHQRGYDWHLPSMTALGYLQIGWYLQGKMSLSEAIEKLRKATHLFIRRQYTWFRKYNQDAEWVLSNEQASSHIVSCIEQWIKNK